MNHKVILSYILVLGFLGFLVFAYLQYNHTEQGLQIAPPSDLSNKTEVEKIVKDVITNNPELIVNSLQTYYDNKAKAVNDSNIKKIVSYKSELEDSKDDPRIGNKDGRIKVVTFFDYGCGYCKKMVNIQDKIISDNPNVELVFKELPILGETSILASKAALAVNLIDPSKYIPFHTALFNIQGSLTEEILIDLAGKVGIDIAKFKATLKDKKVNEIIQKNSKLAQEIGIQGTPAYIIGGKLIAGGVSYEMFQKLIDDAAKDLDKVPAVPEQVQQPLAQDGPSAAPQPASPQDILATEVPDGASNNKSPEVAGVKQGAEQ